MLRWRADQIGQADAVSADKSHCSVTASLRTDASSPLLESEHAEFYIWRVQLKNYYNQWH